MSLASAVWSTDPLGDLLSAGLILVPRTGRWATATPIRTGLLPSWLPKRGAWACYRAVPARRADVAAVLTGSRS